jgi:hypothetical protein
MVVMLQAQLAFRALTQMQYFLEDALNQHVFAGSATALVVAYVRKADVADAVYVQLAQVCIVVILLLAIVELQLAEIAARSVT